MGDPTELAERQRRTLDRLKPLADQLDLYLAGGTAIALHLRHRVSRDLDLFSKSPRLNLERIRGDVTELPDVQVISMTDATLHVLLDGIPVDFVCYPYPLLRDTAAGPGQFPMASLEDLATMKLSAVARRGIRRDFWDLHEIARSGHVEIEEALESYVHRFGVKESDLYHVLRGLTYFGDAEADPLFPDGLTQDAWDAIKEFFEERVPRILRAMLDAEEPD